MEVERKYGGGAEESMIRRGHCFTGKAVCSTMETTKTIRII